MDLALNLSGDFLQAHLSEPQFFHLWNGGKNYNVGLFEELNEKEYAKYLGTASGP